jgi:hypothetical protein
MQQSENPSVRSAVALTYSRHQTAANDELARLHGSDFDAVLRESYRHPDPAQVRDQIARQQDRMHALERSVPAGQAALGQLLVGPEDWKPDPKSDPNHPQTPLGQFCEYLDSDLHRHEQRAHAETLMRALFEPSGGLPSGTSMDAFARLSQRAKEADNYHDGDAVGFLLGAGIRAFTAEAAKRGGANGQLAVTAIQVALAAGLGYGGVLAAGALGIEARALDQAFRAGFSRLGQEELTGLLRTASDSGAALATEWSRFQSDMRHALRDRVQTLQGFEDGVSRATRD